MVKWLQFTTMVLKFMVLVVLHTVRTGVDGEMVTVYDNGLQFVAMVELHNLCDVGPCRIPQAATSDIRQNDVPVPGLNLTD